MKRCNSCRLKKPLDDFYRDRTNSTGYESSCKVCRRAQKQGRVPPHAQRLLPQLPKLTPDEMYLLSWLTNENHDLSLPDLVKFSDGLISREVAEAALVKLDNLGLIYATHRAGFVYYHTAVSNG